MFGGGPAAKATLISIGKLDLAFDGSRDASSVVKIVHYYIRNIIFNHGSGKCGDKRIGV